MQKEIKNPLLSKQNWLNVASLAAGILSLPAFGAVVPAPWSPFIIPIVAGLNLILRNFFTSKPTTEFAAERNT